MIFWTQCRPLQDVVGFDHIDHVASLEARGHSWSLVPASDQIASFFFLAVPNVPLHYPVSGSDSIVVEVFILERVVQTI